MLEAYSVNIAVPADTLIPFNSVAIEKGNTAILSSPTTVQLNRCGVYMVSFDGTTGTSTTVQLTKNGILQPQAQSTGTQPSFTTLVQVAENNTCCPCSAPTTIGIQNTTAGTFTNANIVVTKII